MIACCSIPISGSPEAVPCEVKTVLRLFWLLLAVVVSAADNTALITSNIIAWREFDHARIHFVSVFSCRRRNVVFVGARTWCQTESVELVKFSPHKTPSVKSWTLGPGTNESRRRDFGIRPELGVLSSFVLPTVSAGRCCGLYIPSTVLGDGFPFSPFWTAFLSFNFSW